MQGTKAQPGVIPRVVRVRIHLHFVDATTPPSIYIPPSHACVSNEHSTQALFAQKEDAALHDDVQVTISYMEIYKDECYDLLVDRDTVRFSLPCALARILQLTPPSTCSLGFDLDAPVVR